MFLARRLALEGSLIHGRRVSLVSSSIRSRQSSSQPNPPLNLDPTLQAILQDGDISLLNGSKGKYIKELEVLSLESDLEPEEGAKTDAEDFGYSSERKSPAADFGSLRIGAVIIPNELQNAINALISESDKAQLHSDAKRLFELPLDSESRWDSHYNPNDYHSRKQAARHANRDGTAFATIALPAHYSAILAVFDHLKRRLEPSWKVQRVIDWGAGTGSGLWAALHAFQSLGTSTDLTGIEDKRALHSSILTYLGIDKRDGLVSIAKRLFRDVELGNLNMSWQKSFKDINQISRSEGHDTVALSAFMLTSLPSSQLRRALVKEMWESGAHIMVIIDQSTPSGFEAIAKARDFLLKVGQKEFGDAEADGWPIRGSHVVAPCPHDGACPLHHPGSTRLVCGFSQRIQRPSFVRKTKHSGVGHEDMEYSYVVIRRGPRPPVTTTSVGRIGDVGRRELKKAALLQVPIKELKLNNEFELLADKAMEYTSTTISEDTINEFKDTMPQAELEKALRLESYSWPRLIFPPMKKSGHIILDSCTSEGKIMRLTIPKSQGTQAYYDARKSSWGDIFPHPPKNPPQERYQPTRIKRDGGTTPTKGTDIGKRGQRDRRDPISYEVLSKKLKETQRKLQKDRVHALAMDNF